RENFGIHERFAAGKSYFQRLKLRGCNLVEKGAELGQVNISQPVVAWARLDVAIAALDVAEAAGVDPQRAQAFERYDGALLPSRSPVGIAEFESLGCDGNLVHRRTIR